MAEFITQTNELAPRPGYKITGIGEIPEEWEVVPIKNICRVRRGASPRPIGDPSYFAVSGRGWVRIEDVTSTYKYLRRTTQCLSPKGVSRSVLVNPGDLIMSICATIGKPVIVDMEACIHDGFVWFSNIPSDMDRDFLFYVLQFKENYFAGQRQTGTQGNLNTGIVGRTLIPLPPLEQQCKISTILSNVDENIQKTQQIIEKTEELKKGLMQRLLTRGIGHTRFKETEIGEIPEEWRVVTLGNVVEPHDGIRRGPWGGSIKKEIFVSQGFKVYEQQNVIDDNFLIGRYFIDDEKYSEMQAFSVKAGDILISAAGTIGKCVIVPEGAPEGIINQALIRIRLNPLVILAGYFKAVVEYLLQKIALRTVSQGAVLQNLASVKELRSILVPLPPIAEQQRIISLLDTYNGKVALERERFNQLEQLKKGLMQVLLTGKVRVKNV